jgi:hypothetical protein
LSSQNRQDEDTSRLTSLNERVLNSSFLLRFVSPDHPDQVTLVPNSEDLYPGGRSAWEELYVQLRGFVVSDYERLAQDTPDESSRCSFDLKEEGEEVGLRANGSMKMVPLVLVLQQ